MVSSVITYDYKLWKSSTIDSLSKNLKSALENWCYDWCNSASVNISVVSYFNESIGPHLEGEKKEWKTFHTSGNKWVASRYDYNFIEKLIGLILTKNKVIKSTDKISEIESKIENFIEIELHNIFAKSNLMNIDSSRKQTHTDTLPEIALLPGGGCVLFEVSIEGIKSLWMMNKVCVSEWVDKKESQNISNKKIPTLVSRADAISRLPVRLNASLGETQISLSQLQNLRSGDVVVLEQTLNELVSINLESDLVEIKGFIGESGDYKAFQVVANNEE